MTAFIPVANSGTQHLTDNQVSTGDPLTSVAIDMSNGAGADANFFVVAVGYYPHQGGQDTKLLSSVTDSQGNTYSRVRTRTGANNNLTSSDVIELWYTSGSSVSASASQTFTADFAGATFASISIAGFVAPSLPVTVEASNEGFGSGTACDGGSVTTTGTDRLIIGGGTHTGVTFLAGGFTAGTNMTDCGEYDQSSTTSTSYLNYRLAATATSYTSPETANGTSNAWGSQTVAFKAGGGAFTLTAAQGSYALTGQTAALTKSNPVMAAGQGSYALTGQTAALKTTRKITATQGSYSLTGQTVSLRSGKTMVAGQGSYALTGQSALVDLVVSAGQGSYALNGQNVTLTWSGQGQNIMTAVQGSYTLTGQAALFLRTRVMPGSQGSYTLTGQAAAFTRPARRVAAGQGSYSLSGQNLNLLFSGEKGGGDPITVLRQMRGIR